MTALLLEPDGRMDGCGKKLRHEYLFIINTGDKCIVSHAKFKGDTKTLTETTAYCFRKFPLVKLIQLDKPAGNHKSTSSTNSFGCCFIYLFLFSKSPLFGIPLVSTAAQWWAQWPHGNKILSWNPCQDKAPDPELFFGKFKGVLPGWSLVLFVWLLWSLCAMLVSAKHIVSWPGQRGAQAQTSWTQALHTCRVIAEVSVSTSQLGRGDNRVWAFKYILKVFPMIDLEWSSRSELEVSLQYIDSLSYFDILLLKIG